jgi:hypothetical protein
MTNDKYAREVLRAGRDLGITPRGIVIGFATVSVECDWIMYANRADPETLNYPHERIGSDSKSSGLFQQQPPWWGTVADRMDPYRSACLFFEALAKLDYNGPRSPGSYAQAVQRSSFPDRYDQRMSEAQQLYDRITATTGGAPMGDPVWLPDVLRAAGLDVVEFPGWRDRGHGDFGTIWGVVAHHTGNNPPSDNPGYIANHPTLGLCSQLHLNRAGRYTVVGAGIAWHAGEGSYPGIANNNANQVTIGIEAENNGTEGWAPAQYQAYVRGVAAILRKLGHNSSRVIGHKEWAGAAQGKWDPGGIDMAAFRRDVQSAIENTTIEEVVMGLADDELGKKFPSRSKYRKDNEPVDTLAGFVLNIDARIHEEHVEREAVKGVGWAVDLVKREAAKGDAGAKATLAQIGK